MGRELCYNRFEVLRQTLGDIANWSGNRGRLDLFRGNRGVGSLAFYSEKDEQCQRINAALD